MNNNVLDKSPKTQRESFTELLGQLANHLATRVHDEIELVIQGIRETVRAVRGAGLTIAIGAVIRFAAFTALCTALIIGLTSYMSPVIAAFVTGAVLGLIGVVVVFIGYEQLQKSTLRR